MLGALLILALLGAVCIGADPEEPEEYLSRIGCDNKKKKRKWKKKEKK